MAGDWEEIAFIKKSWTEVVGQPYWEEFGSFKYSSFLLLVEPRLNVLKQHKCMILQFWWLEVQNESPGTKSGYQQGYVCFEGSEENLFPSPFQPLEAALIPWLRASPSIFKVQSSNFCFHCHMVFPLTLLYPFYKEPCDYTGPTQIFQGIFISRSFT